MLVIIGGASSRPDSDDGEYKGEVGKTTTG